MKYAGMVERQTRMSQKHLPEKACGFESRFRHPRRARPTRLSAPCTKMKSCIRDARSSWLSSYLTSRYWIARTQRSAASQLGPFGTGAEVTVEAKRSTRADDRRLPALA